MPYSYSCFRVQGRDVPDPQGKGEGMLHPNLERELGRERVAQMREEVERNRLDARSAREHRLSRAAALSEGARLAKARVSEDASLRGGMVARGTSFVAALLR